MAKIQKPPHWTKYLNTDFFEKVFKSDELKKVIDKAQKEYLYWDTFKYQPLPPDVKPEEAWAYLKLTRNSHYQKTPVKSNDGAFFEFSITNTLSQRLSFIDTHSSSFLKSTKLTDAENNRFIITGLTAEAIATSQIEGANTSRKVAKEMLATKRPARTKSEQMIVNSYKVMQRLDDWKKLPLSREMLLEIQTIVTEKTFGDADAQGRFRNDLDEIVVTDPNTNEIVHTPPTEKVMLEELDRLIAFANQPDDEEDGEFIHPVIKGAILHFWLAYLHPFVDGNGRTARAVFYWFLLKKKYWLVQYLAISRAIVHSRKKYDDVFIYSENENDLTYFILYITDATKIAITKFLDYFDEKTAETGGLKKVADRLEGYNQRQITLLKYFLDNQNNYQPAEVAIHQSKHGVSRQTAQNDLINLVTKGVLVQTSKKRKFIFMPNIQVIKKLLAA